MASLCAEIAWVGIMSFILFFPLKKVPHYTPPLGPHTVGPYMS